MASNYSRTLGYAVVAVRDDQSHWYLAFDGDRERFTSRTSEMQVYASEQDAVFEISRRNTVRFWHLASGVDEGHPARGVEVGVVALKAVPVGIKLVRRYTTGENHAAFL